ncbi:PUA-like domain-containing protein [Boletus edulis]|uniref:PUA-like domain-containing protein n=1 Tax=Boletus edulis BED1 TaxID=1328754 RepID=A0AAD4BXA2_BOLED|nr:PUA-like domain-containing protein [Boletus edulis]KAF8442198.1 PUA-like domain-containing protein [Boletus edulis BED1]
MSRDPRVFRHIPGYEFGHLFDFRQELSDAGVHAPTWAGIHGDSSPDGGAFSICISGGYEDNKDNGDKITYVGSGGRDDDTERQIAHQSFDNPPNKALLVSCETKRPVRVIRGADKSNNWAPSKGYRYDGLYVVDSATMRPGKAGYRMCFFELRRIKEGNENLPYRCLTLEKIQKRARNN